MFERLSERSWAVVARAHRERVRRGDPLLLPGHLLLGVIEDGGPDGAGVLLRLGVTAHRVRAEAPRVFSGRKHEPGRLRGFSAQAEEAFDFAREYADYTRHAMAEPPHLLAGVVGVQSLHADIIEDIFDGPWLWDLGVKRDDVLQEVFRGFHERQPPAERSAQSAADALASRPGAGGMRGLIRRAVECHADDLARGDYEAAVVLRGVLVQLAEDRREPVDDWAEHARAVLQEQIELHEPPRVGG